MPIKTEDLEENNWISCQTCNKICKNPSYDYDLRIDECCLCSSTDAICSTCFIRKKGVRPQIKIEIG
ncbi:MAG: hypothetical protein ACW967_09880 [Candidatus Hodarchaeales archaeon]|jgi:hypothetical protein